METHVVQQLELFPAYSVAQWLFTDVKNAAELREKAVKGQLSAALINPHMIIHSFQILVAANKALHLQKTGKMKTKSLHSEIIFNLSPTNNISDAFRKFGTSDADAAVLVVVLQSKEEELPLSDLQAMVEGQAVPVESISSFSDVAKIKKLYKVTPQEEKCGSLLEAVVCRMAIKDVC